MIASACEEPAAPEPPGSLVFAALGDAPYNWFEARRYERVIDQLRADSLAWILHVGDIFWYPCSDEAMDRALRAFERAGAPVVYTPGDNEWADCWGPREGGFDPLERLGRLRRVFFPDAGRSIGTPGLPLSTQSADALWPEFVENRRWESHGILFATVHLVGSRNARDPFPARDSADDAESRRRTLAAEAWLRETFEVARRTGARAVYLAMHADPGFEEPASEPYRQAYEPFLRVLEEEVAAFAGPVVLTHGDSHDYRVDKPLRDRRDGRRLENFTRMEVMGSPDVGWVRVVVDTAGPTFSFTPHRVPRWRLW